MAHGARLTAASLLLLSTGLAALNLAAPVLASQPSPGTSTPASSSSASTAFATEVSASSWYWAGQAPSANGTTLPASAPAEASNVPAGDRGVAFTNDVDKVTALSFATRGLPDGAVFSTFAVVLGLDPAVHQLANGTPVLVACPALQAVPANLEPGALSAAPKIDPLGCVDGVLDAAKHTYAFELKTLATQWAAGATPYGVVVRPKAANSTPFSYALLPDKTYTVTAAYTPLSVAAKPAVVPPAANEAVAVPPSEPMISAPVALPSLPLAPVQLPTVEVAPAVAPVVAVVTAPVAPVALPVLRPTVLASLRPTGAFWLGGLALAVLLAAAALILGDPMAPIALDERRKRFAQVVRLRSTGRPTAVAKSAVRTLPVARPA